MAATKQATVYIHLKEGPVPAGILTMQIQGRYTSSEFAYGNKYLERPDAVSLDPIELPLPPPGKTTIYETKNSPIFNGIRDASPDKFGRYLLKKKYSHIGLDEFDYVAASGYDRVGALAFGESPTSGIGIWNTETFVSLPGPEKYLDLAQILKALESEDRPDNPEFQMLMGSGPSMGIGGARPKGTVIWNGSLYIAKFPTSSDSYNICLAEYATMRMAKECGISTPKVSIATIEGKTIYLVERFDRIISGDQKTIHRLPFHSALTMTGLHELEFAKFSYWEIVDAITQFSSSASRDRKEMFRRMVFNIFCNNNDDHLKNHGFIYCGNGKWDLSPAYDIVPFPQSTKVYALLLQIGEEGKTASISNALSGAKHFGLKNSEAEQIIEEVREVTKNWKDFFAECGAEEQDIDSLSSCFREL